MDSHKHYHSFSDHLSLYLPHFLRPSLPRDRGSSPLPQSRDSQRAPTTPPPTPSRSLPRESARASMDDEGILGTNPPSLHNEYQDSEEQGGQKLVQEKPGPQSKSQTREASAKSKEGYRVALILTNSGSVARDHLALERTFLAYMRTSLVTASTGVALVQLFTIANSFGTIKTPQQEFVRSFATPLGATLILFALIILLLGCLRYFTTQMALTRGVFPTARLTVVFIVVVGTAISSIIFGVLIKGRARS